MPSCELCGVERAREVSGKPGRLAWLKSSYATTPDARKPALAERIMDLVQESERWRCADCTVCGCCGLTELRLADCAICGAPACIDCSLPALQVDKDGKIIDGSDDGRVLCARCNPPSGGTNAGLGLPTPAQPLTVG
jgi:hypothetical protein